MNKFIGSCKSCNCNLINVLCVRVSKDIFICQDCYIPSLSLNDTTRLRYFISFEAIFFYDSYEDRISQMLLEKTGYPLKYDFLLLFNTDSQKEYIKKMLKMIFYGKPIKSGIYEIKGIVVDDSLVYNDENKVANSILEIRCLKKLTQITELVKHLESTYEYVADRD